LKNSDTSSLKVVLHISAMKYTYFNVF